jgi:hypothetical protein
MHQARSGFFIAAATATILSACSGGEPPAAVARDVAGSAATTPLTRTFKFKTVVNAADVTFNELLGINDARAVTGFYGSGLAGHPHQGYTAVPDFDKDDFAAENVPGAVQTQVTAINGLGDTAGIWVDSDGITRGFIDWNGVISSYSDPAAQGATEILGLNDSGVASGFYVGSSGVHYGFTLDRSTGTYTDVFPPGGTDVTASAINDNGDVAGYYSSGAQTIGFLERNGYFSTFSYPSANDTMAFGINVHDAIVGSYLDASGRQHGFLLQSPLKNPKWRTIDAPNGIGTTTINGVNDRVNMVGYYVDLAGNTVGLLIERKR